MSARLAILQQLTDSRNHAVERGVEFALAECNPEEQKQLANVLLERNRRSGWVTLIRVFNRLDPSIREKIVARPRDLFGPLAETMQDIDGPARENVITIVQQCSDSRLVYLLAEALMDARPEVRELAGKSLLDTVRRHCDRSPNSGPANVEDAEQVRRAIDFALRHFRTHRQTNTLLAALIHERQQDAIMWTLFQDPYDDLTRAATVTLRAPPEAAMAPALLLALASPLKPAAMAGIAAIENLVLATAIAEQSFRLVDPLLRDSARSIAHLKLLPALRKEPPWNITNWAQWLRLVETIGLQPVEKLNWLTRMLESVPAEESAAWKICLLRAIADTLLPEAGTPLAGALQDPDERVARSAGRFLLHRRVPEWRQLASTLLPRSPHMSVRQLANVGSRHGEAPPVTGKAVTSAATRGFERAWNDYQKMPPVVQHTTARAVDTDPAFAEQLRLKLVSGTPQELAQGLRMLIALPSLVPYRAQIISLCGHADPRIAAMAIRLIGRLEDPRLKELLDAATQHTDPRVRANAIESMEELHVADRSQKVLELLNSRHSRERANAIKAIGQFNFATARECLGRMLADPNPLHRMSALWVVEQLNLLEVMRQVSMAARRDTNLRVRKRAAEMLETLSGNLSSHS